MEKQTIFEELMDRLVEWSEDDEVDVDLNDLLNYIEDLRIFGDITEEQSEALVACVEEWL